MKNDFKCPICAHTTTDVIHTYKHDWGSCGKCRNLTRTRRARYLATLCLPGKLKNLVPVAFQAYFFPVEKVLKSDANFYAAYSGISALKSAQGTKWEGQLEQLRCQLNHYGLSLEGQNVLDISGGPGFLVQEAQSLTRRAVVTEFNEASVEGMKRNLGIEAVKFDYNTDSISEVVKGPFDIVLIRYSINFCKDLNRFLEGLKPILHSKSVVFVSFVPPTLGCILRWQHDDYTYHVLYDPENFQKQWESQGFRLICERAVEEVYPYTQCPKHYPGLKNKVLYGVKNLMTLPYLLRALVGRKQIDQALTQKNLIALFKLSASPK